MMDYETVQRGKQESLRNPWICTGKSDRQMSLRAPHQLICFVSGLWNEYQVNIRPFTEALLHQI